MKLEKTYRLWTFQSIRSIQELKSTGILQANWDRYAQTDPFPKAYHWMVKQMAKRNIPCPNNAPIWAWHSCDKYEQAPSLFDAKSLLCDLALEAGVQTIEFECPVEVVLLSSYRIWGMVLDEFFSSQEEVTIDQKTEERLFATERKKLKKYDAFQATLPYLKLAWVKEIRNLNLTPNDFSYNPEEKV